MEARKEFLEIEFKITHHRDMIDNYYAQWMRLALLLPSSAICLLTSETEHDLVGK